MLVDHLAYACLTKHCKDGYGEEQRICWVQKDFSVEFYAYSQFETESNQLANVLKKQGIQPGDVVSIFVPRIPEVISSFFSILKCQAYACFLFSTLGEEALVERLANSSTKIIITTSYLLRKILAIQTRLPALTAILVVDLSEHQAKDVLSLPLLVEEVGRDFDYPHQVEAETPAFLQYTSGSTGKPKAALHVHGALADMQASFNEILMVDQADVYWCTADPAWITGLVYGIIAPLRQRIRLVQYGGGYQADTWMKILDQQRISIWYTAPTALRMLMQESELRFEDYNLGNLKRIYSVGEPLNPEIYFWGKNAFKTDIYDTWFQSETGSIMIANRPGSPIKAGSMGIPRAGIKAEIRNDDMVLAAVGEQGHLCIQAGWPSMFRAYYNSEEDYQMKFRGETYITGDLAKRDQDGYFWYISRSDDVINTGGHLVGPFEVESALLEIDEIGDVAVIGASDPILHQKIVAFLVLRAGIEWTRQLELKCRLYVSDQVATIAIPSEFRLVDLIPKNQSGKILRRVLKALYEGSDPGDLSTMEKL